MQFQAAKLRDYKMASEILHALDNMRLHGSNQSISRVGIQKVIYLSAVLAPVKDLIIELINFVSHHRGPWNRDVQNTLDHLVATDYVSIIHFRKDRNGIFAEYVISEKGSRTVSRLIKNSPMEEEKHWWYSVIVKLTLANILLMDEKDWNGFDRIVNIVYQEPTYVEHVNAIGKRQTAIDVQNNNKAIQLIDFAKSLIFQNYSDISHLDQREMAERIMVGIFDYLSSKYRNPE